MIKIRTETIKLGRIVINYWDKIEFGTFMAETLSGRNAHKSKSYFYHFRNSQRIGKIIYGEIFKARLLGKHEELIPEKLEYRPIQLNELFEFSRFCIFQDHTIAITSKNKFNSEEFIEIFKKLFNLNSPKLAQIEINYRRDDYDIFKMINSFDKMIEVDIKKLRKSNPDPKPSYEAIEAFLMNEQTDEYSANFISQEESQKGLNRNYNSHIMSAISLTDGGYGASIIIGLKNGERIIINTIDKIIQGVVSRVSEDDPSGFVVTITNKFSKYIKDKD